MLRLFAVSDILEPLDEGLEYLSYISKTLNYNHKALAEISVEDEKREGKPGMVVGAPHLGSSIENELVDEKAKALKQSAEQVPNRVHKVTRPLDYISNSNKLLYSQGRTLFFWSLDTQKEESLVFDSRIVGLAHRNSQDIFVATEKGVYLVSSPKDQLESTKMEAIGLDELVAGERTVSFLRYNKKLNLLYLGVEDLLLSITPETGTPSRLLDHEGATINNFEWVTTHETLTALSNGYIYRWDVDGEFKGAVRTSSCEVTHIKQFQFGGIQKGLVACGSTAAVDVYLDFCHRMIFLLK